MQAFAEASSQTTFCNVAPVFAQTTATAIAAVSIFLLAWNPVTQQPALCQRLCLYKHDACYFVRGPGVCLLPEHISQVWYLACVPAAQRLGSHCCQCHDLSHACVMPCECRLADSTPPAPLLAMCALQASILLSSDVLARRVGPGLPRFDLGLAMHMLESHESD